MQHTQGAAQSGASRVDLVQALINLRQLGGHLMVGVGQDIGESLGFLGGFTHQLRDVRADLRYFAAQGRDVAQQLGVFFLVSFDIGDYLLNLGLVGG